MYIIYPPKEKRELRENIERIICGIFLILWLGLHYGAVIVGLIIRLIRRLQCN